MLTIFHIILTLIACNNYSSTKIHSQIYHPVSAINVVHIIDEKKYYYYCRDLDSPMDINQRDREKYYRANQTNQMNQICHIYLRHCNNQEILFSFESPSACVKQIAPHFETNHISLYASIILSIPRVIFIGLFLGSIVVAYHPIN
jgi:hypothetical protein